MVVRVVALILTALGVLFCSAFHSKATAYVHSGSAFNKPENILRVATFNMHGYHPYRLPSRHLQSKTGDLRRVFASPFFYLWAELADANEYRQRELAEFVQQLDPDFLLLQEVAAGTPFSEKNCESFNNRRLKSTEEGLNTAVSLLDKVDGYEVSLACRGKVAWQTSQAQFSNSRVVELNNSGAVSRVVFDYGTNPYPNGMVVEGFAILHSSEFIELHNEVRQIEVGINKEPFSYQVGIYQKQQSQETQPRKIVILNLHAGHKIRNFEQAIAVRKDAANLLAMRSKTNSSIESEFHIILGGDLNEALAGEVRYKNNDNVENDSWFASGWELFRQGRFDLLDRNEVPVTLNEIVKQMVSLNDSSKYKQWAKVSNADQRIRHSVSELNSFASNESVRRFFFLTPLSEGFSAYVQACTELCPDAFRKSRIDHILFSDSLKVVHSDVLQRQASFFNAFSLSDHPLIFVDLIQK